jgi:hypothetical protein
MSKVIGYQPDAQERYFHDQGGKYRQHSIDEMADEVADHLAANGLRVVAESFKWGSKQGLALTLTDDTEVEVSAHGDGLRVTLNLGKVSAVLNANEVWF